jgi:hypothetical protein
MRLNSGQIEDIANRIVRGLARRGWFDVENADDTETLLRQVIAEELRVEDKLNDEVREVMREHMDRIRRADVEYHEMFKVIKARLAKQHDIIL